MKINFKLEKGEKVKADFDGCAYIEKSIHSEGRAFGSGFGGSLGGAVMSSKQTVKEDVPIGCHIYITNKRVVIAKQLTKNTVGSLILDFKLNTIKGIVKNWRRMGLLRVKIFVVDISVSNNGTIDNVKIWFVGKNKEADRDKLFKLLN